MKIDMEQLIEPGRVLCNVEAHSRKHALEILSELLTGGETELSQSEVFGTLVQRERLGSTALGGGVAVPHGRAPGILRSLGAFMKLSDLIDFDAVDGDPVDLIFGMLVPEDCSETEVQRLEGVAHLLSDPDFRRALRSGSSASQIHDILLNQQSAVDDHEQPAPETPADADSPAPD